MRLPFRFIATVPTATVGISGQTISGGDVCNAIAATIIPHGMSPSNLAHSVVLQGLISENYNTNVNTASGGTGFVSNPAKYAAIWPSGLTSLWGISSEIRPVAACIKMGYIGPQGQNAGAFVAYEGSALQLYSKSGSSANPAGDAAYDMALSTPLSQLALDAWTTCDTTRTVEARVNFAACDAYWQTFRSTSTAGGSGPYTRGSGIIDSTTLSDPDLLNVPLASVAVSAAVPGTTYLVSGAIVYEWIPAVTLGIQAPQRTLRDPKVLQTVISQLGKYGRMLVNSVIETGGSPPGLMLDLAVKAFAALSSGGLKTAGTKRMMMLAAP
jgi:hypothetical protein